MFKVNQVHNEDNLKTLSRMPDAFIDLVVTSPPYDDLRAYQGYAFDLRAFVPLLFKKMRVGGVVVWVCGDQTKNGSESGTSFRSALFFMECGFKLYDTMIYYKKTYPPCTHRRYEQAFEYMFVFSKGVPRVFNGIKEACRHAGIRMSASTFMKKAEDNAYTRARPYLIKPEKLKHNVWHFLPASFDTESRKFPHPAKFPFDLARDHIVTWTNAGDFVYDPFCGSGTTLSAAKCLGRKYAGSEVSHEYCKITYERLRSTKRGTVARKGKLPRPPA